MHYDLWELREVRNCLPCQIRLNLIRVNSPGFANQSGQYCRVVSSASSNMDGVLALLRCQSIQAQGMQAWLSIVQALLGIERYQHIWYKTVGSPDGVCEYPSRPTTLHGGGPTNFSRGIDSSAAAISRPNPASGDRPAKAVMFRAYRCRCLSSQSVFPSRLASTFGLR